MHEQTHMLQQKAIGGPVKWWRQYLKDPKFRLIQELQAYRNQYKYFCRQVKDREQQFRALHKLATDLASPMYGGILSYQDALQGIKLMN
jgi:hypothetical protein